MLINSLLNKKNKLLIIGPHPDDVEFSTGRLILNRNQKNTFVFCMTDGRKGQEYGNLSEDEFAKIRIKESKKALSYLGINQKNIFYFNLKDQEVIRNPYIIDKLYILIKKILPDFVLICPWEGAHPDHDATHLFAIIALKNLDYNFNKIIEYGSYNFFNGKLNVQKFIPKETEEFKLYPDEKTQKKWLNAIQYFKSQISLQKKYIPKSKYEIFRKLPYYDYSKLPYEHSFIFRDLLNPIYPLAKKIIPKKKQLYYETWTKINPLNIQKKLLFNKKYYSK
ncbi:MAG: PIG-L family deacetylase [Candidatus Woesearchaeota archaeon]